MKIENVTQDKQCLKGEHSCATFWMESIVADLHLKPFSVPPPILPPLMQQLAFAWLKDAMQCLDQFLLFHIYVLIARAESGG